jgi:hypothetical protein
MPSIQKNESRSAPCAPAAQREMPLMPLLTMWFCRPRPQGCSGLTTDQIDEISGPVSTLSGTKLPSKRFPITTGAPRRRRPGWGQRSIPEMETAMKRLRVLSAAAVLIAILPLATASASRAAGWGWHHRHFHHHGGAAGSWNSHPRNAESA